MTLRVWLHEGHDGEPGVVALGLDHLGFSTWAESKEAVLAKLPGKFDAYRAWRGGHAIRFAPESIVRIVADYRRLHPGG